MHYIQRTIVTFGMRGMMMPPTRLVLYAMGSKTGTLGFGARVGVRGPSVGVVDGESVTNPPVGLEDGTYCTSESLLSFIRFIRKAHAFTQYLRRDAERRHRAGRKARRSRRALAWQRRGPAAGRGAAGDAGRSLCVMPWRPCEFVAMKKKAHKQLHFRYR